MKRPAFQFYPADWRKDMALQSCSVSARGLWMDCLCIAHECEPYGHLTVNCKPMTPAQIGRHTGLTERECSKLLEELEAAGVLSKTEEGAIFSRRMVRDEAVRNARAEGGKAGSEHGFKGAKHGAKGGRPSNARGVSYPPSEPPLEPSPSSSSSSSSSKYPQTPKGAKRSNVHGFPPGFESFWSAYPRKTAKDAALKAYARAAPDEALQAVILSAINRHKSSDQWQRDSGQFVPHASTWLNGRRWADEVASTAPETDIFAGSL